MQESVWPGRPRTAAQGDEAEAEGDHRAGQSPLELQLPDGDAASRQVSVGGSTCKLRCFFLPGVRTTEGRRL